MIVHVVLTNQFKPENLIEVDIKNCVCAVIDVIRATSTIATILGNGGKKIIITGNKKEAFKFKKMYDDYILCGEEGGLPPRRFDYGNSPLEISNLDIKNRNFIMMTTNGTQSFFKVEKCRNVFSLSILNLKYTLDCMLGVAKGSGCDILFLCSGEKGKIAYDDAFVAGLAIKYLLSQPYNLSFTDTSKLVLSTAISENDIVNALEKSYSAQSLRSIGLGNDIYFCSRLNKYQVAPVLN
ncbi:MAG: 2-phosphosulfolactate phosphatase, partial [Actinobacteria bacterium]|nr:2-phosphosulfolactate phosphatase [Actinomycetota bacterium]